MAWHSADLGDYHDSSALVKRAICCADRNEDANMIAGLTALRGHLAKEQCAYEQARHTLKEAQKLATQNRSDYGARHVTLVLAELCIDTGEGNALAGMAAELRLKARKYADYLSADQVAMICKYTAALTGQWVEAGDGLGDLIAGFVRRAEDLPLMDYRWAGLGLEIGCLRLAGEGRTPEAAKALGAAQAMADRDAAIVSPSIRNRWARLITTAGLTERQAEIDEGRSLGSYGAIRWLAGLWQ
jgi:tetratricopeptide (TPR) repeat protein